MYIQVLDKTDLSNKQAVDNAKLYIMSNKSVDSQKI